MFTNGDRDGWAGGSIVESRYGYKMATIVYKNASHCTDTHSFNWENPNEPPEYKGQRMEAVDNAVKWLESYRKAASKDPEPVTSEAVPMVLFGKLVITLLLAPFLSNLLLLIFMILYPRL